MNHYQVTFIFNNNHRWSYMVNADDHADALHKAHALYTHKEGNAVPRRICIEAYDL